MIELKVILINSLFCFGAYFSFWEGNVFGWASGLYEKTFCPFDEEGNSKNNLAHYLSKPLYSCVVCMASVWGALFIYFSDIASFGIISWSFIIHIVSLAGLNYLIAELLDSLKRF